MVNAGAQDHDLDGRCRQSYKITCRRRAQRLPCALAPRGDAGARTHAHTLTHAFTHARTHARTHMRTRARERALKHRLSHTQTYAVASICRASFFQFLPPFPALSSPVSKGERE
eukprot:5454395-Pleurochrysis_carterae.AAC.1